MTTTVNKLKNIWVSNDTTNLDGTYNKVSILNEGKTELKGDTLINTKLAINKNIDSVNDYKLDVGGNVNFTGNLYKNSVLFNGDIIYVKNDANNNSFLLGSGNSTLTGYYNFAGGYQALNYLTTGYLNVAIGRRALFSCQGGVENFGLGSGSLESLTSGSYNTAIGVSTGGNLTTGISNTFIGRYCGGALTTQSNNTFVGYFCGVRSFGEGNTVYGAYSLGQNCYGNSNTIIGFSSGTIGSLTGSNNTIIGSGANLDSTTISNSCAIGTGAIATASNGIFLGRSTEITYPVGGLTINSGTVLKVLGNISANNLTITPTQLSFLNQVDATNKIPSSVISDISNYQLVSGMSAYQTTAGMSSYLTSTITTNLTANSKTVTPAQLGFLSNVSNQQLPTSAITNYGSGFLTSAISSNFTVTLSGVTTQITPSQFVFLNKVLVAPSVNAGLIPKTAISNYTDFVQYNANTTITGTYTFSGNPIFNTNAIPLGAIADISISYVDLFNSQIIDGVKTFSLSPVMSGASITANSISVSSINSVGLTDFVNALIPASTSNFVDLSNAQSIGGTKTFLSAPVMSGASITVGSIPLSAISSNLQTNYYKKGSDQTISNVFTFSTNPVFNAGAIPTTAISTGYLLSSDASSTYQTQSGMSSYLTTATASTTYLTQTNASTTYQTQSGMSSYLTTATASATYLTQTNASTTYQTQSGMSSYLTTATASSTYVANAGTSTIDGIKTFSSPPVMSGASITAGTVPYTAINSSYTANSVATLAPTATSLASPLNNYYTFTSATADTVITLPTITANIIGCPITFRRVGNTTFQLTIKTASGSGTTIIQRASITETAQNTNYVLLATNNYVGTVMAISLTKWSVIA
jgi:hypothetical protein